MCPGLKPRADTAKPTEGAGDVMSGWVPDCPCLGVAIAAPSVGLPKYQPGGLSPGHGPSGMIRRTPTSHPNVGAEPTPARGISRAIPKRRLGPPHSKAGFSLSARRLEPRARTGRLDPLRHRRTPVTPGPYAGETSPSPTEAPGAPSPRHRRWRAAESSGVSSQSPTSPPPVPWRSPRPGGWAWGRSGRRTCSPACSDTAPWPAS